MNSADFAQRVILGYLLERHPAMVGLDDLDAALPDVERVAEAVRALSVDGLVTVLGERVGLTRAAVRMGQLASI